MEALAAEVAEVKITATAKAIHTTPTEHEAGTTPDTPILRAGRG